MYTHIRLALLSASLIITPNIGLADEENKPEEENTVYVTGKMTRYSATKSDTPIVETARSIAIETNQQIIDKGALTLDDTYTYTAGVFGETFGYATRGDWVRVRGLDVPQYQDSLQSLFGNYNNARPDIYTLEQVEILKGPASVLYGKGSPGGIVNVVSKTPQETQQTELVLQLGSFDRGQIAIDSTGKLTDDGNWLYRVIALSRTSDTQVNYVEDNATVIAPSITWRPSLETEFTLLINDTSIDSDTAAQFLPIYGTLLPAPNAQRVDNSVYAGDTDFNHYDTETTSYTLLAAHNLSQNWELEATARYTDGSADYQQAWTSFIGGDRWVYNSDGSLYEEGLVPRSFYRSDATSEQSAFDFRLRGYLETGSVKHEVLIGTQYQAVETGSAGYYAWAVGFDPVSRQPDATFGDNFWINLFNPTYGNIPPAALTDSLYAVNAVTSIDDIGIYISDKITVENWHIMLGVRYDETETKVAATQQKDDALSSSIGALYEFSNGLSPYISYAESFEPVIGDNGNGEPLKPQQGEQVEVGIKYQPQSFPALFTLAYFDLEQSNLTDPSGLPGSFEQQRGVAEISGVEFEMLATLGDFDWEINLSEIEATSAEGFRIASLPETQASTWLTYRPESNNFRAGFGARFMSERFDGIDTLSTPSVTLFDLMLGYQFSQFDLAINARNLTDKKYFATCLARGDCFPGDQQNITARISYRF